MPKWLVCAAFGGLGGEDFKVAGADERGYATLCAVIIIFPENCLVSQYIMYIVYTVLQCSYLVEVWRIL